MAPNKVPRKRQRDTVSDSPSDTDTSNAVGSPSASTQGHRSGHNDNRGILTPPPSSPTRAPTTQRSRHLASQSSGPSPMDWRPVMREVFMTVIRKNHPDFNPMSLNDFELLTLAGPGYKGLTVGIPAWLQKEWALAAPKEQDRVWVLQEATRLCNARMDVIGIKPQPGDPNAKVRKVTNSEYSIRLWPGPVPHWCLDFVHAQTLEPKNEPFDFELWAVPLADPVLNTAPWLPLDTISRRLRTMEYGFGIKDEDVKEGEAKFALMDGQTCVLKRPGERDIRFTVPNRSPAQIVDDTEVMNF